MASPPAAFAQQQGKVWRVGRLLNIRRREVSATHFTSGNGLARSLARPAGNMTGLSSFALDLSPKLLEMLRTPAPKLSRVAVLINSYDFVFCEVLQILKSPNLKA